MPVPAIERQRRMRELGRIRLGDQVTEGGKKRPRKLTKFRLTSSSREMLAYAQGAFGGDLRGWQDAPQQGMWELYTDVDVLPVVVPPQVEPYSLWYELWSGGGCLRRCDGTSCLLSQKGAPTKDVACLCDPDPEKRECSLTLRVNLMLPAIPALGIWRLETHGYYAAVELPGTLDILQAASGQGRFLSGSLRLEERVVKRGGQTRRFVVPALDVVFAPEELEAASAQTITSSSRKERPALPEPPPVPDAPAPIATREPEAVVVVDEPVVVEGPDARAMAGLISPEQRQNVVDRAHGREIGRTLLERICRYKTDGARGVDELILDDLRKVRLAIDAYAARPEAAMERMEAWERSRPPASEGVADPPGREVIQEELL